MSGLPNMAPQCVEEMALPSVTLLVDTYVGNCFLLVTGIRIYPIYIDIIYKYTYIYIYMCARTIICGYIHFKSTDLGENNIKTMFGFLN